MEVGKNTITISIRASKEPKPMISSLCLEKVRVYPMVPVDTRGVGRLISIVFDISIDEISIVKAGIWCV